METFFFFSFLSLFMTLLLPRVFVVSGINSGASEIRRPDFEAFLFFRGTRAVKADVHRVHLNSGTPRRRHEDASRQSGEYRGEEDLEKLVARGFSARLFPGP